MNNLSKWKICAYLAAIFLAGAIAGSFAGFKAGQRMMFLPPRPETMAARFCGELQSRLSLTPAQSQKISVIVNDGMVQFQNIVGADISATFSNCNARIVLELTPAQQATFLEIQKEHERFLHNPFPFHGPPGGPDHPPGTPP